MIEAVVARLAASCTFTAVEVAEDLDGIANGPAAPHGSVWVVPLRERAGANILATGGHRQRIATQIAVAFVIRQHDDLRGAARAAQFATFRTAIEAALAGWCPDDALDPFSLVAGEGTALRAKSVSIYVQTWEPGTVLSRGVRHGAQALVVLRSAPPGAARKPARRRGQAGKLTAAARAWAFARLGRADDRRPVAIDAVLVAELAEMGVAPENLPAGAGPGDAEVFEVMSPNWKSVCAFLSCETQWRVAATMAGLVWLGLDYAAADVVLRRTAVPDEVFADLQVMEVAALAVFRENPA